MEILSVFINFILNKLFPDRKQNKQIHIKGNNNQPIYMNQFCENNNGQININSTVDNSITKNITNNKIIITDDNDPNKEYGFLDISSYFFPEGKVSRYTALGEGTVEVTVEKDDDIILINVTKNCPGKSIELTNGTKTLKIHCSKNDLIQLTNNNRNFTLKSAKFYVVMNKK